MSKEIKETNSNDQDVKDNNCDSHNGKIDDISLKDLIKKLDIKIPVINIEPLPTVNMELPQQNTKENFFNKGCVVTSQMYNSNSDFQFNYSTISTRQVLEKCLIATLSVIEPNLLQRIASENGSPNVRTNDVEDSQSANVGEFPVANNQTIKFEDDPLKPEVFFSCDNHCDNTVEDKPIVGDESNANSTNL